MHESAPIIIKKKKKKAHHGHHGGAWKVAYADFVTAMMAFFMVMWILGMSEKDRQLIQAYFNDPLGFPDNLPKYQVNLIPEGAPSHSSPGENRADESLKRENKQMQEMQEQIQKQVEQDPELKPLVESQAIQMKMTPDGLVIEFVENEMNGEVFFEVGQAAVRPQARTLIKKIGPILSASGRGMLIDGHTDARPYPGTGYDNMDLSNDRANAVRKLLTAAGVKDRQIIAVRGFAAKRPRVTGDPNHFSNRRVSLLLPYKVEEQTISGLPGDVSRSSIEGMFRVPKGVAPDSPQIKPN